MKKKIHKPTVNESKANAIRYMVQDMIDDTSDGVEIVNLEFFEKEVLKVLNDNKWE